jgi:hypothetical protein
VVEQPAAQGTGGQGHDDVVDRAPGCALHLLDVVERDGAERPAAVRADGAVERGAWRAQSGLLQHRAGAPPRQQPVDAGQRGPGRIERPSPVEGASVQPGGLLGQLPVVAGRVLDQ